MAIHGRCLGCRPGAAELRQGGGDVGDEGQASDPPPRDDAGPGNDQRRTDAALRGVELVTAPRSRHRLCPLRADEVQAAGSAQALQPPGVAMCPHPEVHAGLVDRVARLGAIVGGDDEDGIGQFAPGLESLDEATDRSVGGFDHAGVDLHGPSGDPPFPGVQALPPPGIGREPVDGGTGGQQAKGPGPLDPGLSKLRPPAVKSAAVAVRVGRGCLDRNVNGLEGEVGEEGRSPRRGLVEVPGQPVDQQIRGIEVLRHPHRTPVLEPGRFGIIGHVGLGGPVVRARGVKGQGPVEALAVGQFAGAMPQVPLAGHQGPVAFGLQSFG